MKPTSIPAVGTSWRQRRDRAQVLQDRFTNVDQVLAFYVQLLELQEPLYTTAAHRFDWVGTVRAPVEGRFPLLDLEQLPVGEMVHPFGEFVEAITQVGTEVLVRVAQSLHAAGPALHARLLERFLGRGSLDDLAGSLECDPRQLVFFPRAVLQPIVEAMADLSDLDPLGWRGRTCPQCGRLPQVSVLRDTADVKGQRMLMCGLCASAWRFGRLMCANCGERSAEKLAYHVDEDTPQLRVDECQTCSSYLKSVDLRVDGMAVPLVDEVGSVHLDLWSGERGLKKIQPNILGL